MVKKILLFLILFFLYCPFAIADKELDSNSDDLLDNTLLDVDLRTLASPSTWRLFYSNGSSVITQLSLGEDGTFLESNGASAAPAFRALLSTDIPDLSATYQSADSDLTTWAGISPSANVQSMLGAADYAAIKGLLSIDDLVTLSGVADGSTNLGTFTGTTITDNQTIKASLQLLETAVESVGGGHDAVTLSAALGSNLLGLSTQELTLDTQTATYVFAGPTTGEAAAPSFRALIATDIPDLSGTYLTVEVDGSTTNEIEVVDEAFSSANFDGGTTSAVSQDDFYDRFHVFDTDDDGDIDTIDSTLWATKLSVADIDNAPVEDETFAPISSGYMYTHVNAADPHSGYFPDHQVFTTFTGSDATPDVSAGQYFQTADTTTITDLDDGGDSSTLVDGQLAIVLCLHAGTFDFTASGLTSPYGVNYTMVVGSIEIFYYDLQNTTWVWATSKAPTTTVSEVGILVRPASGVAGAVTITGTENEITVTNGDGESGGAEADPIISLPASLDLGGKTVEIPNQAASDVTLTILGQIAVDDTDDSIAWHDGANGEIAGEVQLSAIQHKSWSFDPDAVCDGAVDRLFLMTVGDEAPNGIIIDEWKVSFEADPTTEADLDLKYADAFIGVANAAVIDILDTTTGVSTEDTDASINAGAAVANGKVMYLEFGTAYTEANHQIIFEMWYHAEED